MKIVVDTNVLISATFWYGASFKVMRLVEDKKIKLILSPEIIQEYTEVLEYDEIKEKIKKKNLEMKRTVAKVKELATIINPTTKVKIVTEDPDDNIIIETALESKCDFIISQDKHLLKIKEFKGIIILDPEEFLDILTKNQ